jgi:hypothetical protein
MSREQILIVQAGKAIALDRIADIPPVGLTPQKLSHAGRGGACRIALVFLSVEGARATP